MKLIDTYDLAKHVEIENKYTLTMEGLEKARVILKGGLIKEKTYLKQGNPVEKVQADYYFDTAEYDLAKLGYSLRCRTIENEHTFTLKKPGKVGKEKEESQFIRLEFECKSEHDYLDENIFAFIESNNLIEEINRNGKTIKYSDLNHIVTIENKREAYVFQHNDIPDFKCEVSLDDITYYRHGDIDANRQKDYQIEIELKCNSIYRVTLNDFAEELCKEIGIESTLSTKSNYSKYETALKMLGLCQIEH